MDRSYVGGVKMKLVWEYPLFTDEHSEDFDYEAPIIVHGNRVYYACTLGKTTDFHIIDSRTSESYVCSLPRTQGVLPHDFFAFVHNNKIIYYAGVLFAAEDIRMPQTLKLPGRVISHLRCGKYLLVVCGKLYGIDLETLSIVWEVDLACDKPYHTGALARFGELISCYGQNRLLFVEPQSGKIMDSIQIPRIDKLYHPIALDDDTLLIGYTNWTNAGILKYQRSTRKVIWRHKRRFEGPQMNCRIWHEGNHSYWVKNDTELICVADDTGEETFQLRILPWLYTDLQFIDGSILYGTAGANGYINSLDAHSGQMQWSVYQKNGCAYYDTYDGTVVAGDFSKTVSQHSLRDGSVVDQLHLDGEVVGRITACDGHVYTVIWAAEDKPVRLVKIGFS